MTSFIIHNHANNFVFLNIIYSLVNMSNWLHVRSSVVSGAASCFRIEFHFDLHSGP